MHDPTFDIPEPRPEEAQPCKDCNGKGIIETRVLDFSGNVDESHIICRSCHGKGYLIAEDDEEIPY